MRSMEKVRLNLATRPLRNRRFFRTALGVLAALVAGLAFATAFLSVKYGLGLRTARTESVRVEEAIADARAVGARARSRAAAAAKSDRERVALVNAVIRRKAFLWTALLTELEGALPDSSYITSLVPDFAGESAVNLKVKVVSVGLDDLLALVDNLAARRFSRIRVEGESVDARGRILSEIAFSYERAL